MHILIVRLAVADGAVCGLLRTRLPKRGDFAEGTLTVRCLWYFGDLDWTGERSSTRRSLILVLLYV
jgi:hypothetical protein